MMDMEPDAAQLFGELLSAVLDTLRCAGRTLSATR